jgi:hypothetical protein
MLQELQCRMLLVLTTLQPFGLTPAGHWVVLAARSCITPVSCASVQQGQHHPHALHLQWCICIGAPLQPCQHCTLPSPHLHGLYGPNLPRYGPPSCMMCRLHPLCYTCSHAGPLGLLLQHNAHSWVAAATVEFASCTSAPLQPGQHQHRSPHLICMACMAPTSPGMARPAGPVRLQSCHTSPGRQRSSSRPATAPLLAAAMPREERGTRSSARAACRAVLRSRLWLKKGGPNSCRGSDNAQTAEAAEQE